MIHHPAVLNAVRDAIFVADITTGMIVDANPPAEALSGRTLAELRLLHHTELHPPEVEMVAGSWCKKDPQASALTEGLVLHKDGSRIPVEISSSYFTTPDEKRMLVGVFHDLTERKEASAKLKESKKRFQLMEDRLGAQTVQFKDAQRLAKVGSWERDVETGSINWSEEMLRIFGQSNAPLTLAAFLDHVHPKDREKVLAAAAEVRSSMSPVEVSYRIVRPDGEERFVRAVVEMIRDSQGKSVRTVGSMQDITEQVTAEQLLRESEERLSSAERLAQVGHWHWDPRSNKLSWSKGMFRIFGQPPDYTPSYGGFLEAVTVEDRGRVERELRESVGEKIPFSSEAQIVRPHGELRTANFVAEMLLDEEGSVVGVFGAAQDITDSKRALEESYARQKLESLGTLASGIAHDFNNLLGSVLSQAELALSDLAAGVNPEGGLRAIRDVSIRGSEIVRQLMIYAGKENAVAAPIDLSHVVKEMLELLKVLVSKQAVLETDLGEDLPAVRANAAQLGQIVMNLITNASDALGDRDGVIRVITRHGRESAGGSERLPEGGCLILEVIDTGCGMSPETQARVFDPFFTTKSAGHGLGLAVVSGIVRGMGGTILLTSEPGKGTTFRILLPSSAMTDRVNSDATSAIEELAGPSRDTAVLVVEDEDPLRHAVAKDAP
jgi:two-component system, cell cycle sensor histidine kinase and response regulator CckA